MVNTELLELKIERSGIKYKAIADMLNLTPSGFLLKRKGTNEFTGSEIQKLKIILGLTESERNKIFFNEEVI